MGTSQNFVKVKVDAEKFRAALLALSAFFLDYYADSAIDRWENEGGSYR